MSKWDHFQLQAFLTSHPKIRLIEFGEDGVVVEGNYEIKAKYNGYNKIQDTYQLRMVFPKEYPKSIPLVFEVGSRIPRKPEFHTYDSGEFCLGSEIKIKSILLQSPSITGFINEVLDPFLYSISYKLKYNLYPFGDLEHGEDGLIHDYESIFKIKGKFSVLQVLAALGKRKRVSNRYVCPCGCGDRLGKCDYRFMLQKWRGLDKRRWFLSHRLNSFSPIEINGKNKKQKCILKNKPKK